MILPRRSTLTEACVRWLAGLMLWCVGLAVSAAQGVTAQAPGASVEARIAWMVDRGGNRTFDEVASPELQKHFREADRDLRSGYDDAPIWIRVRMTQTGAHGDWLLALPTTRIRDLQVYGPMGPGGVALEPGLRTGLSQPYATRDLNHERFVVRIRLQAPGEYTLWFRVVAATPVSLLPTLWEPTDYLVARQDKRLFDGIAYGILFTLLMYNLVLGVVLRDRTYGLYVLNCVFALLTLASFNGHAARYLSPGLPALGEFAYCAAPSLWMLCATLFGRSFLRLPRQAPRLDLAAKALVAASLVAFVAALAGAYTLSHRISEVVSLAGTVGFAAAALLLGLRGSRTARWYLAGQGVLFAVVMTIVLSNWGFLDAPFVVANGLQIGILGEMVIFSFALSSRIRLIREENLDLQDTAGRLAVAARTDPLTGLANRAGLEAGAHRVLQSPGVHGLLLLDLDLFKPVNDEFGHQVGDRVLVEVARRLQASVREGDTVARLGGDEFVVLVAQGHDRAALEAQAQRLEAAVVGPIELPGVATVRLACSVGVAMAPTDGRSLAQLIAIADQAMYRAKRSKGADRDGAAAATST